jgi:cell shape-determining protein MreC
VLTAGAREQIPAGIYLGSLTDIQYSGSLFSNCLYLSAKVKPAVNMDTVRFVVVAVKK